MHFDAFPLERKARQIRCDNETLLRLIEEEFGRLCGLGPKETQPQEHLSPAPEDAETAG